MTSMRTWLVTLSITVFLLLAVEGITWLKVGSAPLDVRYECAASAPADHYKIFSYGESTVYGTPVPEYGFMAQIDSATKTADVNQYTVCNMGEGGRDSNGVLLDVERTLQYQPDLIIVFSGHNDFLQPEFEATSMRRWRDRIAGFATIRALNKLMEKINRRLSKPAVQQALPQSLVAVDRNGEDFQLRVARYESNMDHIIQATDDADVPLLFGTLTSNLDQWAPVYRKIPIGNGGVRDEHRTAEILTLLQSGETAKAKQLFDDVGWSKEEREAPVVQYMEAHFMPADTQADRLARENAFKAARDADPIPWRVLSRFNTHVRNAVADNANARLVDIEQVLGDAAGDGAPGYDLITDNCHPTPRGNYLIARSLLDAIEAVHGKSIPWSRQDADEYISTLPSKLRLEYLLRNGVYVMKVPFFDYDASRRYLEEARRKWPADWRSWANLASIELLVGDPQLGKSLLRQALSLQPDQQLYLSHQHSPYLKDALAVQGLSFEKILSEAPVVEPGVEPGVEHSVETIDGV